MAFNLNDFKSNIADKGLLKSHTYECILTLPDVDIENGAPTSSRDLQIRTESVSVPGVGFNTVTNYRPTGYGRTYDIPYSYNPQEITCVHSMDKEADTYKIFTDWAHNVVQYQNRRSNTLKHYSAYYFDDYVATMSIVVYDNQANVVKQIRMTGVYPSSIDQMQLSWATTDDYVRLSVTYRYTEYEVTNTRQ